MEHTYYKIDIQGIVYLIDPTTLKAYTYDLSNPTEIGKIVWTDPKSAPKIVFVDNWESVLRAKLESAPV